MLISQLLKDGEKVQILVLDLTMYKQYEVDVNLYFGVNDNLRVTQAEYLRANEHFIPTVLVVDEADKFIDLFCFNFQKEEDANETLYGLAALAGVKRVYFLSATYQIYHTEFMNQCFDMQGGIQQHKSQLEITKNQSLQDFEARKVVMEKVSELKSKMLEEIEKASRNKPVIVFLEKED